MGVDALGETAHAVRRETRVIDEQADALLDLVAEVEAWYDGPEPDACRARIAIIHARTAAIRTRVEQVPPGAPHIRA